MPTGVTASPIGGVAAFDPDAGGVISAGGVGYDISCGVRCLHTGLVKDDLLPVQKALADMLSYKIPAGVGSTGTLRLNADEMDAMLAGGAHWAVERGFGTAADLDRIEEHGQMPHAKPGNVSAHAKKRQRDEMGTLGSGNHYLEVQHVTEIYDARIAQVYGLRQGDVVISIHCGSRGLGHQIGTEFLKQMAVAAAGYGIQLPDRELACAPINSPVGEDYLGAMRAAINCALANRQILTHLVREVFTHILPRAQLALLYDVSHNTCKVETHAVDGKPRKLYVHRKGRHARLRPGPSGRARAAARRRPAGTDRRLHGHGLVRARRREGIRGALVFLRLPRRRARHEPPSGVSHLERPAGDRRARGARHSY